MDGSRPSNGVPVTGSDLDAAVRAVLSGEPRPRRPEAERGLQHQVEAGAWSPADQADQAAGATPPPARGGSKLTTSVGVVR